MAKIQHLYYEKCADYPRKIKEEDTIFISKWEIEKYAILNGQFNGHVLSKEARNFYSSFYKMAMIYDVGDDIFVRSNDYKCAETSYKVTISFAMGMIAARIIALKKYDIIQLFHLKDKAINYSPKSGKVPDWFGIDSHGNPFLLESKGTDGPSADKETIKKAKEQLNSIRSVTDKSSGRVFNAAKFKKHVIVSCYRYVKKDKRRWYIQDIDPEGDGEIDLEIDLDKECFQYYKAYISLLDSYNMTYTEIRIGQEDYYFLEKEEEKLGIHKSIYDAVKSGNYTDENAFSEFYKNIESVLNRIECKKYIQDSSSYEDGIVVCSSKKKFE